MLAYRELNYKASNEGVGARMLPMLGLYLIVYSILFFDSKTPHPSFYTLMPIIGVALIIAFASKDELVGKILGCRPFVWVGLISYSAYLWHFPIFAFSRAGKDPSNYDKFEWICLTFVLSVLSYLLVEKPFRARALIKPLAFLVVMLGSLIVVSMGTYFVISNDGYTERFPKVVGFENYELDNEKLKKESWLLLEKRRKENPNFLSVDNKVLLVGNSHAKDFYNALVQNGYPNAKTDILRGYLPQIRCADESIDDYASIRDKFYASRSYSEATIILISTRYGSGLCQGKNKKQAKSSDLKALPYLIKRARADGKRVVVLGNTAEFGKVNTMWVADYIHDLHKDDVDSIYKLELVFSEANRLLWANLTKAINKNKQISAIADELKVSYFDKAQLICDNKKKVCSAYTDDGHKVLYDYGHWTLKGAKFVGERLVEQGFNKLLN